MPKSFDAIIVGGGIIGLSTAYQLTKRGKKVLVVEKKYPGSGSTSRCIGGIRQQFSTEASIRLMIESMNLFKQMDKEFGFSVDFYQGGYLFLAHSEDRMNAFKKVVEIQKRLGLNVEILDVKGCLEIVPQLNTEGLIGGVYSPDDGQAYPFKIIKGYIEQMVKSGSEVLDFSIVSDIIVENSKVKGVEINNSEKIYSDIVVNSAGPFAKEVSKMAGIDIPILPEEHEAFITDRLPKMFDTMIVDYRTDGCYFNQRVNGQVIGCYTPIPNKPGKQVESSMEFLVEMSKRTIRLVPDLKHAKVIRHWGGSYSMTPDGSPIIDKTEIQGYYIAAGMSGHGFMFAPATGKYMSEIIIDDKYPFNWDEFKLNRDFSRKELMK